MAQIEIASQLTAFYGEPTMLAMRKDLNYIDVHARAFIARSPFLVLSKTIETATVEAMLAESIAKRLY